MPQIGGLPYEKLGEHYGKLVYAGKISLNLPPEKNRLLAQQLSELKMRKPYIKIRVEHANWVTPSSVLRVSYKRKGKQGGLYNAKLEDLLGVVDTAFLRILCRPPQLIGRIAQTLCLSSYVSVISLLRLS